MACPNRKSFALRIDPSLFKEIEAWAHQDFRSVNGQIEFLLREAVRKRKGKSNTQSSTVDES
ncbi:PTS ascorbate transporter subunit IIC [Pelagicoccus mobilis]|uniref:PTS ascorbate transporter subunit IIC n=1 Tax=Pelagicoccus mobilis TaxID=415221 RepID=A0A934S016_9BACT|nr:PTS ascorbate transporter subunit IIC [Pelagicoccus mobilis]MBK1878685.1 PTS ascorbate transporter subunit IIC [Pelagicoccus mobilis]